MICAIIGMALATITNQTPAASTIEFAAPTTIRVPVHVYVTGYISASHPSYRIRRATIHKPIGRFHDYECDAERGVEIEVEGGGVIVDSLAIGDFSAYYLGIASSGILLAVLLKLFG